jgi:hypothetical protein
LTKNKLSSYLSLNLTNFLLNMIPSDLILPLANTNVLVVPQTTIEHLSAHPEVTEATLELAASLLNPPDTQQTSYIDLFDYFGNWGFCSLVKVESVNLFAFRRGRNVPTHVTIAPSQLASKIAMVTKPIDNTRYKLITAYCSDGTLSTLEPISYEIDPQTNEGRQLRNQSLDFWSYHALSLDSTPIDGEPFESTWEEIIAEYGDYYQNL